MNITANQLHFRLLNQAVREAEDHEITIKACQGQRYIGSGSSGKTITIEGIPGNALGAYLNGSTILVKGNAQDAVGDTMNSGAIMIDGSCGDTVGYAMRGGKILIRGDAGYRAGIHMKAYKGQTPVLVVGGVAGSFLGEYQAGGIILVLGIGRSGRPLTGNFCATGMHGGSIYLRSEEFPQNLSDRLCVRQAEDSDMLPILPYLSEYCARFGGDVKTLLKSRYYLITPNTKNPYKQLYTIH